MTRTTFERESLIEFSHYSEPNGLLVVTSQRASPFPVKRVFTIHTDAGRKRGEHAHRRCSQLLTCVSGIFEVLVHDGRGARSYVLDRPDVGLCIPPMIWAAEVATKDSSVLAVLCDMEFDERDYIRDFDDFLALAHRKPSSARDLEIDAAPLEP